MTRPAALALALLALLVTRTVLGATGGGTGGATAGSPSASASTPRPSLKAVQIEQTLLVLDEVEREQRRRRETLARVTAEERAHQHRNHLALFFVIAVGGVTAAYVERQRRLRVTRAARGRTVDRTPPAS
ncbi:MAG: hypothetical protein NVSMB47_11850 [Polyangiales bacterium]